MSRLDEQYHERLKHRDELLRAGVAPYPVSVSRTHRIGEVLEQFADLADSHKDVAIVGRIRAIRSHGGSTFWTIEDGSGTIQCYAKKDEVGEEKYQLLTATTDIGDFCAVQGVAFTTKRGEKSILLRDAQMAAKSLYPLPEKWHGLKDVEVRYRKRELDLVSNPEVRDIFKTRAAILAGLRAHLNAQDFLEVQTPILQPIAGGATARPFVTKHNALDTDLYLRVAPELYLKRLLVGGFERVYDLGPCFRNEGMDVQHNPEFFMLECYAAYWDLEKLMVFTENLLRDLEASVVSDTAKHKLNQPFAQMDFREAFLSFTDIDIDAYPTGPELLAALTKKGIHVSESKKASRGRILDAGLKAAVRPKLLKPTFLTNYPVDLSPLAKRLADRPKYVHRFQLFVDGHELANAFGELNDPLDQEERFKEQEQLRQAGDEEAQRTDEDFLDALKYGMPPTAGIGIGIERLVMLFTGTNSIKEVILFPTLRPQKFAEGDQDDA